MTDYLFDRVTADLDRSPEADARAQRSEEIAAPIATMALQGRIAIKGTDAPLDRAVTALADLAGEIDKAAGGIAAEVRKGSDPDYVDRLHAGVKRTVEAQLRARASTATAELDAAKSRAYAALLPDVTDEDALAPDRKRDLERALAAAEGDASRKFSAVWQRFADKGDQLALRLLANDFGRDAYVLAGGKADAFDNLREGLRSQWIATPAMKDNPTVKRLNTLTSTKATAAIDATATAVQLALGRLDRAKGGRS